MIVRVYSAVDRSFILSGEKIPENTHIDHRENAQAIAGALLDNLSVGTMRELLDIMEEMNGMSHAMRSESKLGMTCLKSAQECEIK